MAMSKAKLEANNRYLASTYEQIAIRVHKDERIKDRVKIAATRQGITPRKYILTAIKTALDADGVGPDTTE